ncbi:MAG: MFS transporter [Parahaliea sp.]
MVATLAQNLAIGLTYGSYGLLLAEISATFDGSRSSVSMGIALVSLVSGLSSPVLGFLLDRWSIRGILILGSLTASLGFFLASQAETLNQFLLCFGLIVGVGITAIGVLPANKLAANWFPDNTGKALGCVSMPILIAIGPPVFSAVAAASGWRELFATFAVIYLLPLPLFALVKNSPAGPGVSLPRSVGSDIRWFASLADRRLWLLSMIAAIMFAGSIILVTHIAEHAVDLGLEPGKAALLLSVNGATALLGALAFGWLADGLTPSVAVAINLLVQALVWPLLVYQNSFTGLMVAVGILGLCGGGATPALSSLVERIFGREHFGTIRGQISLLVIPVNFSLAPLAGLLYDHSGSYTLAFWMLAGLCLGAVLVMLLAARYFMAPATAAVAIRCRHLR